MGEPLTEDQLIGILMSRPNAGDTQALVAEVRSLRSRLAKAEKSRDGFLAAVSQVQMLLDFEKGATGRLIERAERAESERAHLASQLQRARENVERGMKAQGFRCCYVTEGVCAEHGDCAFHGVLAALSPPPPPSFLAAIPAPDIEADARIDALVAAQPKPPPNGTGECATRGRRACTCAPSEPSRGGDL